MDHYTTELLARDRMQTFMREAAYRGPRRPGLVERLISMLAGRRTGRSAVASDSSDRAGAPLGVHRTSAPTPAHTEAIP